MIRFSITVLGLLALVGVPATVRGQEVAIGVARVEITPDGPIRLSGYMVRETESVGVEQPLWAKAVAIGADDQKPVLLVAVDSVGVPEGITAELASRLQRRAGLPRERLALGSSHTHSAPCVAGNLPVVFGKPIPADQQERIARYTRELTDKLERVCLDALADRKPGRLAWARGEAGFAANRRTPGGPVDHSLPVLKATGADGALRAIVVNYACHCTTIDPRENLVCGDWAGYAQAAVEADHPGCVALTLIGCGADANPKRFAGAAAAHGRSIADEVKRLLGGAWSDVPGPPVTSFERLTLPFDRLPTRADLERLVKAGGPPGYNASLWLARLDRGESLPAELPYSVQAWRFADKLAMVFLPGEVVVDYALRLKKEFDPARLWVTAYANDVPCYIPSERILREGGYEGGDAMVYYGHPTRFKTGVEQKIVDAVHRVVGPSFTPADPKAAQNEWPPALSPAESLRAFRVKPGLKVELVAAEPLIESPVAIDFGTDGRLWVCEMRDYPSGLEGQGKPGGVIKVLEDRDHDGQYESARTFLDGLPFPTGVMAWRKGVIICAAPEILYAEDTDGDGKADVRRVLFQGFSTENFQARVNGLAYGLDNWVYGANGLIGGKIRGLASGRVVDIGGRDFRMKPDTGEFEPASGLTQQGRVRDDWGNQFGGNNSVLIQHYPLPDHAARRNDRVAAPPPAVALARHPDPSRLFPASRTLARFNDPNHANHVTSACSPLIYRDRWLGPEYAGNAFACEPVHNLVRRLVLEPDGVTFRGSRAKDEQQSEFLASTDSWCRPVQVRLGPDGALWVVDMYRFVIEHPRWISPERLATLDVRAGADRGRIYRVVPEEGPARSVPNLETLAPRDLAAALDSPNGTLRDNVHRLLVHRGDRDAAPVLVELVRNSTQPECRAQALGVLDGLDALESTVLRQALTDSHPGVRREAVRLAGARLGVAAELGPAVLALADDSMITVRYQVALSLGDWTAPEAGRALGRIAVKDGADRWVRAAVLSSSRGHAGLVLEQLVAAAGPGGPASALVEPLIATVAGANQPAAVARALVAICGPEGTTPDAWRLGALAQLLDSSSEPSLRDEPAALRLIDSALAVAVRPAASLDVRLAAVRLLGRVQADREDRRQAVAGLLNPGETPAIQLAAVQALARAGGEPAFQSILDAWTQLGPTARAAALDALLARPEAAGVLLSALEGGRIAPSEIDATHREELLTKGPEAARRRAARLFSSLAIGPRRAVLDAYASIKTLRGDRDRGQKTFERVCSGCHKLGGIGHEVGPDLAALTDTSAEALMVAILDPNREFDARYASYNAALKDGRVLTGLIAAETASAIALKRQGGGVDEILRIDLEELAAAGRSLMPEGLENDLKPADLADLIAFLGRGQEKPKTLKGNRPALIKARPDGSIRLEAATAEVYGPSLTFESEFANLGYWHRANDRAVWTFRVDRPTTFVASLEWACDDASAGNAYQVRVGDTVIQDKVASTGGWSNYHSQPLKELSLPPGVHRLEMSPQALPRGALADVRTIVLTPRRDGDREK